jgi:hypothetical protein
MPLTWADPYGARRVAGGGGDRAGSVGCARHGSVLGVTCASVRTGKRGYATLRSTPLDLFAVATPHLLVADLCVLRQSQNECCTIYVPRCYTFYRLS